MTKNSHIRIVSSAWSIQHGQPIRKTDTGLHDGVSDYENPHTLTNGFTVTRCVVSSSLSTRQTNEPSPCKVYLNQQVIVKKDVSRTNALIDILETIKSRSLQQQACVSLTVLVC